jgi:uncharacterized membrane protein YdfJ with MMPL/SSD domain
VARVLQRIGTFSARHKWVVLGAWVLTAVAIVFVTQTYGSNTSNDLSLPGTDSQRATDLLAARFPPQQNGSSPVVFYASSGKVTGSTNKQAIQESAKAIAKLPHVASAVDPFSQQGAAQISKDERTAFIPVLLDVGSDELTQEIAESVVTASEPGRKAGMKVAVGGPIGSELSEPATESSELVGLIAAMIILAFTFGTLVAMGLPIVSAVVGLVVGLSLIGLLGHVVTVPQIAPTLATMIGLGVGIDYALFLVSRHRAQRKDGMPLQESIAHAVATAGSAIVFAGTTVVVALITLLVAGIPLVTSIGYSSAFAVVTAVLAAITLLPAVLSIIGDRIDSVRLPAFLRPKPKEPDQGFWGAWARFVTGRPWLAVGAAVLFLAPLVVPLRSLDLGQEDIGATPKSTTERQAYDYMAQGFGPGYNGPLLVAVQLGSPAKVSSQFESQKKQAQSLQKQLEQEQAQGTQEQQQLEQGKQQTTAEQTSLEKQQEELEAEQATLEAQADDLKDEQARLTAQGAALKDQEEQLLRQLDALGTEAEQLVRQGAKLAKEAETVVRRLARTRADERAIEARLQRRTTKPERARLEQKLRKLERQEQRLERDLDRAIEQEQALRNQSQALVAQSAALRTQQRQVADDAVALAGAAAAATKEAEALVQRKQQLVEDAADVQVEAANLQTQAAQLQTGQAQLQGLQQQAKTQQQQADQLQQQLTDELTKAGGDERGTDSRLVKLQDGLSSTAGVKLVSPPQINKKGDAAIFTVIATTDPADEETAELVETLRTYVIPQATRGSNLDAFVGGQTASYVDLASEISARLLLVILVVIALGFLVLLAAFRSVVVSAQAALANVFAVCAAFGVLTACFQWGWGLGLVGVDTASGTDPIASYVPLMMFAVLFGLSMDYQVFLLSQVGHHRAEHEDDRGAVAAGLASSARVITAAALIMISVFGSFILNGDPTVKQFGVGLAVGVFLAATTVLLLAPALLVLAGRGSWWVPRWLDRVLPHIDIEGARATAATSGGEERLEAPPAQARP